MPYDDYSDSDESDVEEVQTSVLLGLPDGPIISPADLSKPRISRIGGLPVYPSGTPKPPSSSTQCQSCSEQMEMLVQLWCPFESSAYDRTLHVWACARPRCQRKEGSVKAIRALRFNAKYAAKLEAKATKEAAKKPVTKTPSSNPFSSISGASGPQLFGGGFGDDEPGIPAPAEDEAGDDGSSSSGDPSSEDEDEDEEEAPPSDASPEVASLASTLENTSLDTKVTPASDSPIQTKSTSNPSYPALYLDTIFEYITPPSPSKPKTSGTSTSNAKETNENQWGVEGYERQAGLDETFERFVTRVENEPQQCVRYDLSGTPLPFASESVYKKLWVLEKDVKPVPGAKVPVTGGKESIGTQGGAEEGRRVYDPSGAGAVPPCEACGSPRVFEMQVMPNLINVFREARKAQQSKAKAGAKTQTDEERRAEVARLLRGEEVPEQGEGDMEWGTILVFSCIKDCCRADATGDGKGWTDVKAAWKGEHVLVQWDT